MNLAPRLSSSRILIGDADIAVRPVFPPVIFRSPDIRMSDDLHLLLDPAQQQAQTAGMVEMAVAEALFYLSLEDRFPG